MFDAFDEKYSLDAQTDGNFKVGLVPDLTGLSQFFADYGGASFEGGLYRVIHPADLPQWQERVELAFPGFSDRVACFAFDWAGRIFALDTERLEDGQAGVLLFEPGTGEMLRIPANLETFHCGELIEYGEAALGISFYEKWKETGGDTPAYDQCVGYKRPLFLSGVDDVENLEVSDLDVYWHIMAQLIQQTRGLPPGSSVRVNLG